MLTLAFAQIVWSIVFQWEDVTGGSNGILGIWPRAPFDSRPAFYLLTLALVVAGVLLLRRFLFAPFGYAMRAGRDSPLRAEAIGIDVKRVHWLGFAIAGAVVRRGRRAVRLRQGLDLAGDDRGRPLDRRAGHGAARRHADADRPDRRRLGLRRAAGHRHAPDRISGARCSAPSSWCWCWRFPPGIVGAIGKLVRGAENARRERSCRSAICRKSFGGVHAVDDVSFDRRRGRIPGADRAERRRQIDLLQHDQRPARAGQRRRSASSGQQHRRACGRATSGASASAAPSRSPRPSAR